MDSGVPTVTSPEETIWTGRPSHYNHLPIYVICGLLCWLIIPALYAIWKYFELNCETYELTTQRLRYTRGVLNREEDELELYRVKDINYSQPLVARMFGLGNVTMHTSDKTTPEVAIAGIEDSKRFRDLLRDAVERRRDEKRVREIDFE